MSDSTTGNWPAPAEGVPEDWPTVPGYEIMGELGRGGMGVVYKARQASQNRLVALKLIRDRALAGPEERARFRIEAESAARMQHPHIVQIYEVGEHAGRPYFAMELVEGGSLDQYLSGRLLPATHAAELLRTVALAVQHAHAQKVVHRDLKPANILLAVDSDQRPMARKDSNSKLATDRWALTPVPKIADFGLAKRLDSASTALTHHGAVLGTAGYMAPEQAAGRVDEIGPATDVYGLGAILYELLTGRTPFSADSWNETVQQVLHDEPQPPTRLQPDVPPELETVCLKCLEKEPGRRYVSAMELADDLARFLAGQPVVAVPLAESERLARLAARDGYQLVGAIGHGPCSTVYHANFGSLKQAVAVKVFRAGMCTCAEWDSRLGRAAGLWAALAHPQVVNVQRAGWWDIFPYVVQEYIPQGSLAAKLADQHAARGSRDLHDRLAAALRLVEQLTVIVIYLHRQGVIHGNLKPSNVLLAASGIPRILDFHPTGGLFQGPLPADDDDSAGMGYLAPELSADPQAVPRLSTDIYGLGLILYELLTGRPPFAAATAREMLEQVQSADPIPPSRFNIEVTPDLDAFCLRCLRKSPWRRYSRAYDVLRRLHHFQDDSKGRGTPADRRSSSG
jgi:eukaryotic-like serine/threonine-protein kinase